jgi:Na+/H+ antiporter NhaD/arsenite permease-like protein
VDVWYYRQDRLVSVVGEKPPPDPLRIRGLINLTLITFVIAAIVLSAFWRPGVSFAVYGTALELQDVVRDLALVAIAVASLVFTPEEHRERNGFTWEPIVEVAKLFAGIFVCIIPVMAMLEQGRAGPFSGLLALMTDADANPHNVAYFWVAGALSAVLDNAPTYLVFFGLAGDDAVRLMGDAAPTLAAITMGSAYMGALTYIGNAPNFMIYAIATERGVKMPSFFRYMAWSAAALLPVFAVVTYVFMLPP